MTHLASEEVTSVAGIDDGEIGVMIDMSSRSIKTVSLFVEPPGSGNSPRRCGMDSGYEPVSCQTNPDLIEVVTRASDNPRMPVLMGRYNDETRGSVLVQLWGSQGGGTSRDLVRELLADNLLGAVTSASLNDEGSRLKNFEELQIDGAIRAG